MMGRLLEQSKQKTLIMKKQEVVYSQQKKESKIVESHKRTDQKKIGLLVLIATITVMVFANALLIIMNSNLSQSINFDSCYTELVLTGTILLVFLKSYRISSPDTKEEVSL